MKRILWNKFIKGITSTNCQHRSIRTISKNGNISLTYLYRLLNRKNHPKTITNKMAYRIGRGLGMTDDQSKDWVTQLGTLNKANSTFKSRQLYSRYDEKLQQEKHPVIVFYPKQAKISSIAKYIKQIMGTKQISMKNLAKVTFINKQRLHNLFNGTTQTLAPLTCVRIADGLGLPALSLLKYNHTNIIINSKRLDPHIEDTQASPVQVKPRINKLSTLVSKLDKNDQMLVQSLVERLLFSEQ